MDQLAPVIAWTKKNIFWLVCGTLSVAMIFVWFLTTGDINEQRSKQESALKSSVSTAKGIKSVTANALPTNGPVETEEEGIPAHPNETSLQGMQEELSGTIDSIVAAWKIRKQAQDSILVWPKCIPSEEFVKFFSQHNPPETMPDELNSTANTNMEQMLTLYKTKIPEQMSYLCGDDVLRAYWKFDPKYADDSIPVEDEDDGGGFGGGFGAGFGAGEGSGAPTLSSSAVDLNQFAVKWSDKNQDLWNKKLTTFDGYDDNLGVDYPTPLQCYMLQQDLWLLEAMFRIIREVNGDSAANDLSIIKNIDHVAFGREVGGKLGELTPPDQRLADKTTAGMSSGKSNQGFEDGFGGDPLGEEEYDEEGNFEPDGDFFNRSMPSGGEGDSGGSNSNVPYDNRYVDVNFEPLSAAVVKGVISGDELPVDNLELIVARRVPVRIALKMDERKIADFMAACANSPFAFEIQQVRWNRHTPGGDEIALGGSGGSAGASTEKRSGMGNDLGMDGFNATPVDVVPVETRTNYDVYVEFFGIVKIYNPVGEEILKRAAGLEEDADPLDDSSASTKIRDDNPTQP
ncbi:MAG: hypothetical protein ACKVHR_16245 [Pirellulales bacterium]